MTKRSRNRKKARFVLRILMMTVAAVIIGTSVYSINARTLLGNALPMPFGIGTSVVLSGSMEPALSVNDLVVVKKADIYEEGDVVIYQERQSLIIHRIVKIDGDSVITKGDANNTEDEPISLSQIKGKLLFSIHAVGSVIRIVKSGPFAAVIIVGIILLMALSRETDAKEDLRDIEKIEEEIRRLKSAAVTDDGSKE